MHRLIVLVLLAGCQGRALESDNAKLTQRVADLERANTRLEGENKSLKQQMSEAAKQADAQKKQALFATLGLTDGKKLVATVQTSMGDIHCTLRHEQAPETVLNFVQLARGEKEWTTPGGETTSKPLYDGTIFHRVIPDFMIQGGDPKGNGTGGPGYQFADEVGSFTVFDHPGILAMANSGPDTNGSQFFITEGTPTHLNGKHTIFGDCENLDVVAKIARVEKGAQDRPVKDVVIRHIAIEAK
jgi:peptidyl-prolyl cis-trans isomerase A (cyclophilin A)